ncbi:MAG: HNH endonuclease [Proteobacteria bacterium]|nr:HNH endonuclease [Pseudomonadota bacterium]
MRKPKHPCPVPGCGVATRERYCPDHARHDERRYDATRPSSSRRGYDRPWRKKRLAFLHRHSECAIRGKNCPGLAGEVDHIVPLARGGADNPSNWQPVCKPCHSTKTVTEDGGFVGRDEAAAAG